MDPQQKLQQDIKRFLEVYQYLSSEGRARFEAQMAGEIKNLDEPTKKLYLALLQAAKDGRSTAEAVKQMKQAV